jgi:hypothetical protein
MNEKNWVCTTCSQGFTRKYGADRHIRNLHSGLAKKVRLIDYIIGRLSGTYSPADPSLFRRWKKQQDNPFSHDNSTNNNNKFPFRSITNDKANMPNGNILDPIATAHHNSNPIEQELDKAAHKVQSNPHPHSESHDRLSYKFEEIKKLWKPYFSSQSLDYVLLRLALRIIEDGGDDSFVDEFLAELNKKVNMMKALDQLSFPKTSMLNTDSISQERIIQQGPADNPSVRYIPEAARIKLGDIEQMLKPYYPPAFVQNVITELMKRYNETGDYSIFDRALENHRRNAEKYRSMY